MEYREGDSAIRQTKDVKKFKRPGRDKESRMKDLSEEESSGDSDIPILEKEEIPIKGYSSQGVTSEVVESELAKDGRQSREKDCPPYKFDNQKGRSKDKRQHSSESSSRSSDESLSVRKSKVKKKIESRIDTEKEKITCKHGASSNDWKEHKLGEKIKDSFDSSSSSESSDNSSQTRESKREGRLKAKKIKEAIIKRIFAKKRDSLMVSIERKKYESSSKVGESQKKHSSDSESEDVAPHLLKGNSSKTRTLKDVPIFIEDERKVEGNIISQTEVDLDIKEQSENLQKKYSSDSRSSSRSNDSFPKESNNQSMGDGNETSKGGIKMQDKVRDSNLKADGERAYKSAKNSESSDNSSDSERARYRKRGRKVEKTKQKEKSTKRMPSKSDKKKSGKKHHGERKHKKRGSSVSSSSSSSSSKSMSDSSSSSSGTSSSSSTSKTSSKTSVSKERSSSSSSSTSSSSVRRHKRKFKNKDSVKRRSRSPLKIRKKNDQPPRPKKIHVGHLTKNVNKHHLYEIFSLYGVVKNVDLPIDKYRSSGFAPRGFAYVEYDKADDAEKALHHMNGGIIDGQKIKVAPVIPFKPRMPMRRLSPNRRPFGNWRYTPPFRSRGGGALMNLGGRDRRRRMRSPPRRRSPRRRTRSRSPIRRRRMRRTSRSSSR